MFTLYSNLSHTEGTLSRDGLATAVSLSVFFFLSLVRGIAVSYSCVQCRWPAARGGCVGGPTKCFQSRKSHQKRDSSVSCCLTRMWFTRTRDGRLSWPFGKFRRSKARVFTGREDDHVSSICTAVVHLSEATVSSCFKVDRIAIDRDSLISRVRYRARKNRTVGIDRSL